MEFFRIKKDIPFMRHALIFNIISFITFLAAVFFLWHKGLHLSGEFTGGTVMEVTYKNAADLDRIRNTVRDLGFGNDFQVQNFGRAQDVMINLPVQKDMTSVQQSEKVMTALIAQNPDAHLQRVEFVGPQVGDELTHDGLMALGMVVIGIIIYLAFRFEWKYAVSLFSNGNFRFRFWQPYWPFWDIPLTNPSSFLTVSVKTSGKCEKQVLWKSSTMPLPALHPVRSLLTVVLK